MNPFLNTYNRYPVSLVKGEGCRLQDSEGRWYLDGLSGIGVSALGHQHPRVMAAIQEQLGRLLHVSNLYSVPVQTDFAVALAELYGGPAFLCNSGAEANEAALKVVRKYHWRRGAPRPEILVQEQAFHGRTLAALALTGREKFQQGFGPIPQGFRVLPAEEIADAVSERTAAVFIEPVRGEGGCLPTPAMHEIAAACKAQGALLVYDEIQCGLGRTGRIHHEPEPDLRTLAKALGGGLPLGACVVSPALADVFQPGDHGSTFGGNPLACAAGLATLLEIQERDLPGNCARQGEILRAGLEATGARVTGEGLMLAAHLGRAAAPVVDRMREAGVLVCPSGPEAVRFLPPFILSEAETQELIEAFATSL